MAPLVAALMRPRVRLLLRALPLGMALQATSIDATAQAATPAPAPASTITSPVVTPPVVTRNDGVAYPRQALDDGVTETVEVPLVLDVDAAGAVRKAVVEKPAGHGFDEAAVAAAQGLEFQPATRDGKPVAARIRFVYRFAPPPGVLAGRVVTMVGSRPVVGATITVRDASGGERTVAAGPDGAWRADGLPAGAYHVTVSAPGMQTHEADETLKPGEEASAIDRLSLSAPAPVAPADAGAEVVEEVEVKGEKPPREVTKRTVDQREMTRIPGTGGDALRSLQSLPGVARAPGFAGLLIVRGSAPQDTQYFIDGTPVPIVYHFGGLSSVVPTEMLDHIDFFPGNFSTQYGRAMGGIVDVAMANPKADGLHAMAEASFIDARFIAQGPVFDTGWTFAVGGRRSVIDAWIGPVLTALDAGVTAAPVYYDYQAMLERKLSTHETFRVSLFGSDDRLAILLKNANASEPSLAGSIGTHTGFWRAQALYKNHLSNATELRANVAVGEDYVNFNVGSLFSLDLTDVPITSRVELAQKLGPRLTMNTGFDVIYAPYTIHVVAPPFPKPGQPPPGPFSGAPQRVTDYSSDFYEPAFYTEWEATPWPGTRIVPGLRLDYTKATGGWDLSPRIVVRQDVARAPRTTLKGGVGLFTQPPSPQQTDPVFGMPGLSSERAYHYDLGVEHEFTRQIEGSLEGFYKALDRLVVAGLGNTGSGQVYGAEVMLKYKPDARFFGWLAYTLSHSVQRDAPGMPLRDFLFDETHILTVLGSYRLGRGWEFGARYRLVSGYLDTLETYGFYDENVGTYLPLQQYPPNGTRLPTFQALDLRVDKTWQLAWGNLGVFLDVINTFNNGNVDGLSYDYNSTHQSYVNDLPFLPSLGVRGEL